MIYRKEFTQFLPIDISDAWKFFSDPTKLSVITPPEMNFKIISGKDNSCTYAGQIITYYVSPLANFPLKWVTEITHVQAPNYFVDEQRKGPYKMWHHQHHFKSVNGGVEMTDILHYEIGYSFIGRFMNNLFIEKKINAIFEYREKKLKLLFEIV